MKISLRARQNRSYDEGERLEPPSIKMEEIATLLKMFVLGFFFKLNDCKSMTFSKGKP